MKKIFALMLAALMLLSFAACSGNGGQTANATQEPTEGPTAEPTEEPKMSKEEMLEIAVEAKDFEINNAIYDNIAKAQYSYCGKVLLITGTIYQIEADHICLNDVYVSIDVYLPIEDIVKLENRQSVIIVGETDDTILEGTVTAMGTALASQQLVVRNAYLVSEYIEMTGKLASAGGQYALELDTGKLAYFSFSSETLSPSDLDNSIGKIVTVKVKRFCNTSGKYTYYPIEVLN